MKVFNNLILWLQGSEKIQNATSKDVSYTTSFLLDIFNRLLPSKLDIKEVTTFEEAINWFSEYDKNETVEKGAILRQLHPQGNLIIYVLLDQKNQVIYDSDEKPYGRKFIAQKLDDELQEAFGEKNVIIIE